jgi:hypothetical protein
MPMLEGVFLLLLAGQDSPVARWTFDVGWGDGGPRSLPTRAEGRLEALESPIGKGGRLAVFNGVDAWLEVDPPDKLGAGSEDFSVSVWVLALDRRPATLLGRKSWSIALLEGGALRFRSELGTLTSPPGACPPGQWNHVLVSIRRAAPSRILVNGGVVAGGEVRPGDLDPAQSPLLIGKGVEDPKPFTGLMDEVELYARALDVPEAEKLTDQGMPWLRPKARAKTPFAGKFELLEDDVVTFTGGEDARVGQELGYLETLLSLAAAGRRVHVRSMAWEGDTVYEQPRPLNFGSWTDQFRRSGTSVIVAQFGQVEALEGKSGVGRFGAAYESLLSQFSQSTRRIILVSPAPFGTGAGPDLRAKNDDLQLYVDVIRKIAEKNGYLFIDLSTRAMSGEGLSRDGLHLSAAGHWAAARESARQLEIPGLSDLDAPDAGGPFRRESLENLRSAIRAKNRLWSQSWRPANWAFLNGDRIDQPSSRDHLDRRIRWFPVEIQSLPALVRREEHRIEELVEKK